MSGRRIAVELQNVSKQFGDVLAVDHVSLQIADGTFFSLLGPSGCGKTTTLRMIAGFEQPTQGEILIQGQAVAGIPAYRRPVNTVFQNYALFPHMTVAANIAFGLEMSRTPRAEITRRVGEALELVRLPNLGDRKPTQLSGGQQQRVALARALVNRPKVLLLDEPLGALDLKLRKAMQLELKHIQEEVGITFIYVTHDQEEALTMSDAIAVMSDGVVRQVGAPRDIYERPANRFVADFIGETNFLEGEIVAGGEKAVVRVGGALVRGVAEGRTTRRDQPVTVAIRPEKINLYPPGMVSVQDEFFDAEQVARMFDGEVPTGSFDMRQYLAVEDETVVLDGRVEEAIYIGTDTRYRVALGENGHLFVRMQNYGNRYDTQFNVGDNVLIHWAVENAQILTE
ncbi:MAG: ABC transporter ATP-binding protein [Anaerolineales bacterium]|nr:ABC transporter ATP-binding protein [Anaerolineales bacterium]MCB8951274.1 ABC transporter ATP-binding protein [Ardenticatenales bacterium]